MAEEGPFAGVIGFSQGAALASSMMLEHAKSNPVNDLFKLAIFAGASLPFDLDDNTGLDRWQFARTDGSTGSGTYYESEFDGDQDGPLGLPTAPWDSCGPLLGRYHPGRTPKAQIHVPTLHIIGKRDDYAGQSQMLAKLCTRDNAVIYHSEGHRIPQDQGFQNKIGIAIDRLIEKVNLRS